MVRSRLLRTPSSPLLDVPPPTAAERASFRAAAQSAMYVFWPWVGAGIALAALVWWPTDLWFYADRPEALRAMAWMRGGVLAANLGLLMLVPRAPWMRRHVEPCLGLVIAAQVAWVAWCMGRAGAWADHMFPFIFPAPFFTVAMVVPLRARLFWAALTAAGGWLAAHPAVRPSSPESWDQLSFLGFTTALAVGLGHLVYRLLRGQWTLRTRLAAREAELEELASSLESRVAEQATVLLDLNQQAAGERLRERARISRDLHDGLGQELTGARLVAGALLAAPLPEDTAGGLREVVAQLGRSHQTLRRALDDLAPAALEEHGLVVAVRGLVEEAARRAGLEAHLDLTLDRAVPPPVAVAVFRVAQEALHNVVRHARARRVRVALGLEPGALVLSVADDGVGLPADPTGPRGRFGLAGMATRVAALGGQLEVHGGAGVTVTVRVPLVEAP